MSTPDGSVLTASVALARLALAASAAPDEDALRTRTLWNAAAAAGEQDLSAGPARVFGKDPSGRAMRLAMSMHARTQDDFYPPGRVHVGAAVLPAVLAVGDGDLFPALAAGYEVLCAVAAPYAPIAQARGLRPTGVFGALGAAATAAVALGLGENEVAAAIGLAGALSGGTNQAWKDGSDEWMLQVGVAARTGVEAALLVQSGTRVARHALDGPTGWAAAFFDDPGATRLGRATSAQQTSRVAIKPFPVSGIAQVPTHLATLAHDARVRSTGRIVVHMCEAELAYPGSDNRGPFRSRSDSLMSVARCVALGLADGAVSFAALANQPSAVENELLARIEVVVDADLDETEARLEIGNQEFTGNGEVILYPSWGATRQELVAVARRTECSPLLVEEIASQLSESPQAPAMRKVLSND